MVQVLRSKHGDPPSSMIEKEEFDVKTFYCSHNDLIAELKEKIKQDYYDSRKLHCEGHIYSLYVNLKNNIPSLDEIEIVVALQEIDTLERMIMMDHYRYSTRNHYIDYRGEYPCRTSAIIIEILSVIPETNSRHRGFCYVVNSLIKNRLPILGGGY